MQKEKSPAWQVQQVDQAWRGLTNRACRHCKQNYLSTGGSERGA